MRRILLIRHDETTGNAARLVPNPDIPLPPRGEAQAEALARRLAVVAASGAANVWDWQITSREWSPRAGRSPPEGC